MSHIAPYVVPSTGRGLLGVSLGFHAYSLRIDNLSNQWLQEQSSLAWVPPYSLGVVLRLYGTSVALLLLRAPTGQPQLAPVQGEYAVAVFADELRNEVAGVPVREFSLVQAVSDLTRGPQPAFPPTGVDRLYAAADGSIHHLHADGTDLTLIDSSNAGALALGGDLYGTIGVAHINVQWGSRYYAQDANGIQRALISLENNNVNFFDATNGRFEWLNQSGSTEYMRLDSSANLYLHGDAHIDRNSPEGYVFFGNANTSYFGWQTSQWVMYGGGTLYRDGNIELTGGAMDLNCQSISLLKGGNQVIYWRDGAHYLQYAPAGQTDRLAWTHNFQAQDFYAVRNSTQGAVFFGTSGNYLFFDGSTWNFGGAASGIHGPPLLDANMVRRSVLASDAQVRKIAGFNANSSWSSSTAGWNRVTPLNCSGTIAPNKSLLWTYNVHFYGSLVSNTWEYGLAIDGQQYFQQLGAIQVTTGNQVITASGAHVFDVNELPAGSHTFEFWIYLPSGTVQLWTNDRQQISVSELMQ